MLDLFIEMTNQVFWKGYAEQLSIENPSVYHSRLQQFAKYYIIGFGDMPTSADYFVAILQKNYDLTIKKQLQRQ